MQKLSKLPLCWLIALFLTAIGSSAHAQLADVTQPGDPIVGTSNNTPGSEVVANVIDNQQSKYLNFDKLNTGFTVTPRVGLTLVQCLTLTSANDAVERDPASYTLEGSYDGSNFTQIASGPIPAFTTRYQKQTLCFSNSTPYLAYRLVFPTVANETSANSMQISEVELLGSLAPTDVTQPGDAISGTSNNTPGSEVVANAIDNQPSKYLNFDKLNTGFTVTPSVGGTLVTGITLTSANDAVERDPASYTLEGSLDGTTFYPISSGPVPAFPTRGYQNFIFFPNSRAFKTYRLIFPTVANETVANSMQIREVELLGVVADVAQDVTQPGDPIVGSSNNTPGSEVVANVIDNQPTKYLNFDKLNTGFTVSPRSGLTLVSGLTLTSANDAVERDPASYILSGSYDGSNFTQIATGTVPAFAARHQKLTILFDNKTPYLIYRLVFPTVVNETSANSMQIEEVELLGVLAPTDVTVPGDPIVGTSNNTPGSEVVANAIDNQPSKYLNFDKLNTGFTVTPGVGDTIVSGISLTSANDGVERDPASYALSGSLDGSNFVAISSGPVPPFPSRFYKNYIFFPENTKAFKSYRLIFPTVANETAANSMQISEVELLGITPGVINTNPATDLIVRQPQDAPVLLGTPATFRVQLSGPWRVQWYRNGQPIPGASTAVYTTLPTTAADDGATFQAIIQSPHGVQASDVVMLSIFTPSTTQSIGINFMGSGANGTPTSLLPTDITGFQPQAYWNNVGSGSGSTNNPVNSANQHAEDVIVSWATSGEWGVGTGNSDANERLFNGIVTVASTTESNAQTITFSGVPAGSHTLYVYTVQVLQEFFNLDFVAVTHSPSGDVTQRRYIRPQNGDEYNALPGFSLVTAEDPATRGVGNFIRFDNLHPGADGIILIKVYSPGRVDLPGGDPIRGPGVNAVQLVLNPPDVGAPPVIVQQPASANGIVGGQVTLAVQVTGPNLSYEWLKNGQVIAGATNAQLTLSNLQTNNAGSYVVVISNPAGRVASRAAIVGVVASAQVPFGLITYFKLDGETGDMVATNSVPGGVNGEVRSGFFEWGPGQIGNALQFDDGVTHIFVPDYPKVRNAVTVAGWVNSSSADWGPIINNWVEDQTTGASGQFLVDIIVEEGQPVLRGQIEVGPNRVLASGPISATLDTWHHFAMSANGVNLSIYWDGQLIGTVDYLGTINVTPAFPWLAIGARFKPAPGETNPQPDPTSVRWNGLMDDLAIWNRSLSGVELLGIYNAGLTGKSISEVAPILNINRSPVATDIAATTAQGAPVTINLLANTSDPDTNDVVAVSSLTSPLHGTAVLNADGTATYTPAAGYSGADSFTYTVGDGHGGIGTATVNVTITPSVGPTIVCSTNIVAACTGTNSPITWTVTATSSSGSAVTVVCTPPSGTSFGLGTSNVTCVATDALNNTDTCTFTVTVRDQQPPSINCPTNNISVSGSTNGGVANFSLTANDACQGSVAVTCVPASGSTFPLGTNTVVCTAADGSGQTATCSFSVIVTVSTNTTTRAQKQECLNQLIALRATVTEQKQRNKIDQAIDDLQDAIESDQWIDGDHLERKHGDRIFREDKEAVATLMEVKKKTAGAAIESILDCVLTTDRQLVTIAIDDATGLKRNKLQKARKELHEGDDEVERGKYDKAVDSYRRAWLTVAHAKISAVHPLAAGGLGLDVAGDSESSYTVQASSNLIDWVDVGTVTTDDEGNAVFKDNDAAKYGSRFYRIVEPDSAP